MKVMIYKGVPVDRNLFEVVEVTNPEQVKGQCVVGIVPEPSYKELRDNEVLAAMYLRMASRFGPFK